ncbi:hypothetical protein, variant 1 [Aphanomyces invadans]|nr:hypothetical protein, variant 1 [Aphanomyces invadans]ETV99402.1 hypothetical protein, variant 1 [Aphanomyces invadans]|eukprot:XP_008871958.1 hypothetical protein, variant 1 [Aphanomyces invadans]
MRTAPTPGALVKEHDISTKQLMDDALVDHDVSESGGDSDDETKPAVVKPTPVVQKAMYKINSYTALTKLDKGNKQATPAETRRTSVKPVADTVCSRCTGSKDMPSMHFAAYAGHTSCLAILIQDTGFVAQDKHHRTPLFYACASNQAECTKLLIEKRPQWIDMPDSQLDTPVHVSCFFGWEACLEVLLEAGANPHVRNAKGFRPSHITKTPACLKILVSHGDDLLQGDKLGRTPLFVACTRNRVDCVEFLCQWNYQVHSWMLEQEDDRSDRPIHAAACNGSIGSLEILIKYGADVFARNARGLTAIDLAVNNHHTACVDQLQKAIKDAETASTWFHPANARHENRPQTSSEWSECMDTDSGYVFFYNNLTGKCQWEMPEGFMTLVTLSSVAHARFCVRRYVASPDLNGAEGATSTRTSHAVADSLAHPPDDDGGDYVWVKKKKKTISVVASTQLEWMVVQDPGSKAIYYKNTLTGESQWEEPEAIQKLQHDAQAHTSQHAQELWDELNKSRDALAERLEQERARQLALTAAATQAFQASIQARREEMHQKELKTLLPKSSFVKAKHKPPSMRGSMMKMSMHTIQDVDNETSDGDADDLTKLCDDEPFLNLFLGSFIRYDSTTSSNQTRLPGSKRSLKLDMTGAQRIYNGIFHYYLTLLDPFNVVGMSKAQFRVLLKDAGLLPNPGGAPGSTPPPLKLHAADMIFTLLATPDTRPDAPSKESMMLISGFYKAMVNVGERAVAGLDEKVEAAIDDVDAWFCTEYMLPLLRRLASKMAENVKLYKDIEAKMASNPQVVALVAGNRVQLQTLHRFYSSDSRFKLMTFQTLSQLATDFALTPTLLCSTSALYHVCEAINWINGHSYTVVISFEKFVQICRTLAVSPRLQIVQVCVEHAVGPVPPRRSGRGALVLAGLPDVPEYPSPQPSDNAGDQPPQLRAFCNQSGTSPSGSPAGAPATPHRTRRRRPRGRHVKGARFDGCRHRDTDIPRAKL